MALFVDGQGCTIEDLTAHDSGLLDVAETEGIDVTKKIVLAQEEIAPDIQLWLDRPRFAGDGFFRSRGLCIEQVVVTSVLKRWLTMQSLTLVYSDAYFCRLVDRFQAKWNEYLKLARTAREQFVGTGVGIVSDPIHRAALPTVNVGVGSQPGGTYYAAVSYLNPRGQEGAASEIASITVTDGYVFNISPSETVGSWNVYAGPSPDGMCLQNLLPLSTGDTWSYVPGATVSGAPPGTGQRPDFTMQLTRTWMRG